MFPHHENELAQSESATGQPFARFWMHNGLTRIKTKLAGGEVRGERPSLVGILLFTGLMLAAAWGAWKVRYWAVLGIQALLGLTILIFSLLAVKFENALELAIAAAVIGGAGTLFWFLVKSMARIQMPERPGSG